MTVPTTGIGASTGALTAPAPAAAPAATNELGKDAFLKLLVAQLKYQDPMNPAEGAEFIAQTAQFTQVERLQEVADSTAGSLALQQKWGAGALVGKDVTYLGEDGMPATGRVTAALFGGSEPLLRVQGTTGATEIPFGRVNELRQTD